MVLENQVYIKNLSDFQGSSFYNDFLEKHNSASFFHTLYYYNSLIKTPGTKPVSIVITGADQNVRAAALGEVTNEIRWLPYLTRRLIFYAPPLNENVEYLGILLENINKVKSGLFIQIRTFNGFSVKEVEIYKRFGYEFSDHLNAFIILKGESKESILSNFKKDKRKGIIKASDKYKLSVKEFDDIAFSVDTFYRIQEKLYKRKRHSLKTKEFFYNLVNESDGKVRIAFALYQNEPIATQMYISYKASITALYTATLHNHLDKHAGDLLVWYLIQKGLEGKMDYFDFGGGGKPDIFYSPRSYKERFGTVFNNAGRLTKPNSCFFKPIMSVYNKILAKH